MKTDDISLLSNLDNLNEKLPFHYPISFKNNYDSKKTDNKIDLEVFYNIYNNYNKNPIKNKKMIYDIKFKENKNDYDYDEYNSEKISVDKKHKYKFIPRRKKNASNNLSENLSLKNNSLNNNSNTTNDNIKNIKYNSIDKNNYNMYINEFSNHLIKNSSLSEDNMIKKGIKHTSSNSNQDFKRIIDKKKEYSLIPFKKKFNSFGKKNDTKNMIFKRNNNNISSSKSYSLINKNKSPLNRPKSYEYKPNDIINNKNKEKNKILYNNKMSQIDKYLNIFTYDNKGKNYISFNKNRIKKNNSNENKERFMKNMNINLAKDYNTEKGIFRKKNHKNSNNQFNNIFKDYYISKDPYLRHKEEDNNKFEKLKNDKQLISQHKKMNIVNSQKRIYNCKDIYCMDSNINQIKNKVKKENKGNKENKEKKGNKYEKIISTIQPNNNGKNKKMKRFIEGIFKYQKYKEIQLSETSNFYHKNSSERIKINNLNKIKSDNLNKDFGNNNIKEEKKERGSNTIDKAQQNLYKRSIPKNKNRKINNIPHSKKELHTISSHKDIYNKKDKYQNKLGMNTYNKFYISNFSAGKKRVIDNFSLNTDYQMDTYNTTNNENNNNNISETHNNLNLNLIDNKINTDNYFRKRNNSSFNILNNQEKNISDIRRYLHNYYEIKNRNNIRKNNSFNNINNFYQKEKVNNYIYKNNLLKNLIEEDKNNNNNNYFNNLSSNVNININITPNQISNKSIDINVNESNRNIINNKNNSDNNNEYNSMQILTPSFNRTKKELVNEGKISMQKFNMNNAFNNYDGIRNENKESQNSQNIQNMSKEQSYNNKKLKINEVGYDYTFKNNLYDYNLDDANNEKQINNNFCFKIDSDKRKEDLIQLLHFSENLRLNCNK